MHALVPLQHGFYGLHRALQRGGRCFVFQPQGKAGKAHLHARPVGDGRGGEFRVRHNDKRVFQRAHLGRAQADVLHRALHVRRAHPVANFKGPLGHQHKAAEKVAHHILPGQRERKAAQAQAGQHAVDVVAQLGQHHGGGHQQHQRLHNAHNEHGQRAPGGKGQVCANALNQGGQLIGRAQQAPGDEHNAGNAANGAHGPQGRQGKAHGLGQQGAGAPHAHGQHAQRGGL